MSNLADLRAVDLLMVQRMAPWANKARDLIAAKVEDAKAHASKAITESAKDTTDGRPTARLIRRSPSFQAAQNRLGELADALAGPSINSTQGLVRAARRAFYRDSFKLWKKVVPKEAWSSPNAEPTQQGETRAAGELIHGLDLRQEIGGAILVANRDLTSATNAAATQGIAQRNRVEYIETWATQKRAAITRVTLMALSDSDQRSHVLALLDLIHPELRGDG